MLGEEDVAAILRDKQAREKAKLDAFAKQQAETAARAKAADDLQAAGRVRWERAVLPLVSDCFNDYRLNADALGITATASDMPQIPAVLYTFAKPHSPLSVSVFFTVTIGNIPQVRIDRADGKQRAPGTTPRSTPGRAKSRSCSGPWCARCCSASTRRRAARSDTAGGLGLERNPDD